MRKLMMAGAAALLAIGLVAAISHDRPLGPTPVVVELFTSQG